MEKIVELHARSEISRKTHFGKEKKSKATHDDWVLF